MFLKHRDKSMEKQEWLLEKELEGKDGPVQCINLKEVL